MKQVNEKLENRQKIISDLFNFGIDASLLRTSPIYKLNIKTKNMGEARRKKLRELETKCVRGELTSEAHKATETIKIGMHIIKPHYDASVEVKKYSHIRKEVKELKAFVNGKFTEGLFESAFSLSHCEVQKLSWAFFVVNSELIKKKIFKHRVFINPKIVNIPKTIKFDADKDDKDHENNMSIQEACMMFPNRKPKKLDRPYRIEVTYQVPVFYGFFLETIHEELEGLQSQIFQHNVEHIEGRNIFFKK